MTSAPVLCPERAKRLRQALLLLAAAAGAVAGGIVLGSQEVADFLREGPVRLTDLRGDTLRIVLGAGTLAGTAIAVLALWPAVGIGRLLVAGAALAGGFFLIHALLMPAAGLLALAVVADGAGRVRRDRAAQFGPRRYPIAWAAGGIGVAGGVAALAWLSVWLVEPLFDEGETLNEQLTFRVEGAAAAPPSRAATSAPGGDVEPTPAAAVGGAANAGPAGSAGAETPPAAAVGDAANAEPAGSAGAETPPAAVPGGSGQVITQGELMGVDAFHTGSGAVQLIEAPDGSLILRFEDYAVRNGPDLHVYLTPDADGNVHADGAVDLGEIKATQGSVNYDVPAGVDARVFRSAVIYCQPFSVTFATAPLE